MPLYLVYTMVQKSQKWTKTQIKGGPALSNVHAKKVKWVLFSSLALFGLPLNFLRQTLREKRRLRNFWRRSTQGKPADGVPSTQSLVAQGRWQLFAVQFLYETVRAWKRGCWKQVVAIHGGR